MVDDHSLTTSRLGESIKLSRVSLRDEAVQALRTMIVDGTLAAGTRINEAELAATLGISRGPLREAIQRVGAEGLIQFRRNRGAFVRELALGDIRDMYEARLVIEGMAARWAARHATEAQIVALRQQVDHVDGLLHNDPTASYPPDSDFHLRILELACNRVLEAAGRDLHVQLRLARLRSGSSPGRATEALDEHRAIVCAIGARDEDAADEAITRHLRRSFRRLQADDRLDCPVAVIAVDQ